jgi:hypothetical protein
MNEILIGFVLGIATMVSITILALGAIAFFKVIKLKKLTELSQNELNEFIKNESIENLKHHGEIYDEITQAKDGIYKSIDSRLEKLEQKLTKTLQK